MDTREKAYDADSGAPSKLQRTWEIPTDLSFLAMLGHLLRTMRLHPPVEHIREYYGEHIGLYFALCEHVSNMLLGPSLVGVCAFLAHALTDFGYLPNGHRALAVFDLLFALSLAVTGPLVVVRWMQTQAMLAISWGMCGIEKVEQKVMRPAYHGMHHLSPVTGEEDFYFPPWFQWRQDRGLVVGRWPRQLISYSALAVLAATMGFLTVLIAEFRGIWVSMNGIDATDDHGNPLPAWWGHQYASPITAVWSACQAQAFCSLSQCLSRRLNEWENWRTSRQHVDHLIAKLFIFEFVNRFNVFIYVAFVKARTRGCVEFDNNAGRDRLYSPEEMGDSMCYHELRDQVRVVLLVWLLTTIASVLQEVFLSRIFRTIHETGHFFTLPPKEFSVDMDTGKARMSHFLQEVMEKDPYGDLERRNHGRLLGTGGGLLPHDPLQPRLPFGALAWDLPVIV